MWVFLTRYSFSLSTFNLYTLQPNFSSSSSSSSPCRRPSRRRRRCPRCSLQFQCSKYLFLVMTLLHLVVQIVTTTINLAFHLSSLSQRSTATVALQLQSLRLVRILLFDSTNALRPLQSPETATQSRFRFPRKSSSTALNQQSEATHPSVKHGRLHDLKRFLNHHMPHPNTPSASSSASPSSNASSSHTPPELQIQPADQRRGNDFDTNTVIQAVPVITAHKSSPFSFIHKARNRDKDKSSPQKNSPPSTSLSSKRPSPSPPGTSAAVPILSLSEATHAHLSKKYGKWGRVLGTGAGGTVRLIRARTKAGGAVYAVKQFRPRRSGEPEREYENKVRAEFCVGACLKHVNVIETVDIVCDHGHYYEVRLSLIHNNFPPSHPTGHGVRSLRPLQRRHVWPYAASRNILRLPSDLQRRRIPSLSRPST